jgi:hypothetical protein
MATNIKITALSDITSANMTYNDLVAVVDMNGTPETKKSTVQLVGNLILAGAGGSNFVPAAVATLAGDVTNAAQPNITSVGNLTSANVTGNLDAGNINATTAVTAAYFSGDGANLTNVPAGPATSITDGTSNVDIPTTDGNVVVGVGGTPDVLIATSTGVNVTGTFNATGVITGDAGGISNVVYANVTGTPTLGNISPLNLDGNVSNVLRGDGTFAADSDTAYGDSNVVTLLNAFGSNTITTTGLVTADGGGLSNVPYANVTGTPTLGNISTIDIDGNSANYLDGTGAWGPVVASTAATVTDPAQPIITSVGTLTSLTVSGNVDAGNINATGGNFTYVTGDGANLTAIAGANVTGEVPFAAVANSVAGANVSGEVGFAAVANSVAYANVSGTPTLGNIASIDIDGSASNVLYGNGVFAPASAPALTGDGYQLSNLTGANVSGEVSFAATANAVALANVSGAGNIASIDIDGSASNVLYGNGVFAAAPGGGSYGDSNVVTLLNAFGSNTITTTGLITGDGGGLSNIAGANVTGTINTAVLAQEVINSAQPNIGSVGTLSELLVSNTIVSVGLTANTGDITVTAGVFAGDGGSISNVVGANVTGEVGFAAVANSVAIANVSGAGNIATVNLDGNTANYLDGTGSWGPVTATTATTAGTVTTAAQPNITSLGTLVDLDVTGNISGANINANTNGFSIGYLEIPQVTLSGNDTIALEDSGKHFRSTTAGNITLSIPTNATVAFPTGTAISIVEQAAGNILVNAIAGVTLYQAGNSTAGNRVISEYGVATIMKVDTDTWFISGTGVS